MVLENSLGVCPTESQQPGWPFWSVDTIPKHSHYFPHFKRVVIPRCLHPCRPRHHLVGQSVNHGKQRLPAREVLIFVDYEPHLRKEVFHVTRSLCLHIKSRVISFGNRCAI